MGTPSLLAISEVTLPLPSEVYLRSKPVFQQDQGQLFIAPRALDLWRQVESQTWSPALKSLLPFLGTFRKVSFEGFLVSTLKLPQREYNEAETSNLERGVSARVKSDRVGFDSFSF